MAAVRKIRDWAKCYKDMYDNILDQKIAHIIQCVDAPHNTLFEIIDKIRKGKRSGGTPPPQVADLIHSKSGC